MSKFVDDIIKDIKENKNGWVKCNNGSGIRKDSISIIHHGNSAILSVIHVIIDDQDMTITYMDRYRLEKAVTWWYKNIDLKQALR